MKVRPALEGKGPQSKSKSFCVFDFHPIFQLFFPKMVVISDGHFDISNKNTMLIYIERFGDLKELVLLNIFMVFV